MKIIAEVVIPSNRARLGPYSVSCPTCGADSGEVCYTRGGRERWGDRSCVYMYEGRRYRPHGPRTKLAHEISLCLEITLQYKEGWFQ